MADTIDRVGLGVDLVGGPEVLADLRALREEMSAITLLTGRKQGSGKGGGPKQSIKDLENYELNSIRVIEKAKMDSIRRIAKANAESSIVITPNEIGTGLAQNRRRDRLKSEIKLRSEQEQKDFNDYVAQRRQRIRAFEALPDFADRNLKSERTAFRKHRNDSARDEQTNVYRRQLSEEIQAQRNLNAARRKFEAEESRIAEKARTKSLVDSTINSRGTKSSVLQSEKDRQGYDRLRQELDQRTQANRATRIATQKNRIDSTINSRGEDYTDFQAERDERGYAKLRQELDRRTRSNRDRTVAEGKRRQEAEQADLDRRMVGPRATRSEIEANFRDSQRRQANFLRNETQEAYLPPVSSGRFRPSSGPGGPGGGGLPPSGGGGGKGPDLGGPKSGALNERGFFTTGDAVGRITRNILLYEVISRATFGLGNYIQEAITAAKTTVEFANALRFATQQAGGNLAENEKLVESLRPLGLSRQQGRAAVTEAARFTESKPENIVQFTNTVANIAAARGGGIDRTDELIEQLRRRESKFYKRIFGKTVETVYDDYGKAQLAKQTNVDPNLFIGKGAKNFDTQAEKLSKLTGKLDETQKAQIAYDFILSQGYKFEGEAAQRADTLAGRIDKFKASLLNAQEGVGLFITEIKPLAALFDGLAGSAGILDKLRPPSLGRSGPNGEISNDDIRQFGIDSTTGTRARLLESANNYGPSAVTGLVGAAAFGLLGRNKATTDVKLDTYRKAIASGISEAEAIETAKGTKAGIVRSVGAGLQRVTLGLTQSVNNTTAVIADTVNLQSNANNARLRSALMGDRSLVTPIRPNTLGTGYEEAPMSRAGQYGGIAGGLLGAYAGAEIGSLIAKQINAGPIIATTLTILGGVAGTALGTTAGSAIAGVVGASAATAGGYGALLSGSIGAAGAATTAVGVGAAGLLGYGVGSLIEPIISERFNLPAYQQRLDDRKLAQITSEQSAFEQKVREQRRQNPDEVRFRLKGTTNAGVTGQELVRQGTAVGDLNGGYINYERVVASTTDRLVGLAKVTNDATLAQQELNDAYAKDPNAYDRKSKFGAYTVKEEAQLAIQAKSDSDYIRGFQDPGLIKEMESRNEDFKQKQLEEKARAQKKRDEAVTQQGNALSKLRDSAQGSFRMVGDIGTSIAGEDNLYVKVLADQITAAERMRQQWGYLGQSAVDYFTKLELGAAKRQLTRLEYNTFEGASNSVLKAGRERDQRSGPGISRADQDYLDIQSAILNQAIEIPKLWAQAAKVMGIAIDPIKELQGRIAALQVATGDENVRISESAQSITYGQTLGPNGYEGGTTQLLNPQGRGVIQGFSSGEESYVDSATGAIITRNRGRRNDYVDYANRRNELNTLSPEARRKVEQDNADATLGILNEYTPQQIRQAGLAGVYGGAIKVKQRGLAQQIEGARAKALYGAKEDDRLAKQLKEDASFREAEIRKGGDPNEIGRQSDALILKRTEGVNPKDLTFDQFSARQDALRRDAERQVKDQEEAKLAVQQGLEFQESTLLEIQGLRDAILNGDLKVLIQVQNDTQARVDQEALQKNQGEGGYQVPLDQGRSVTAPSTDRFGRYGRKQ